MKRMIAFASIAALGLGVAACSGETEDTAEDSMDYSESETGEVTEGTVTMSDDEANAIVDEAEAAGEEMDGAEM